MLEFHLTATDLNGKRSTQRITAPSAKAAMEALNDQGCTDIVLHTDDVAAIVSRQMPPDPNDDGEEYTTPADEVEFRFMTDVGYFFYLLPRLYLEGWLLSLISVVVLALLIWSGFYQYYFGKIIALVPAFFLVLPLGIAIHSFLFSTKRDYDDLVEAGCWGRWEEVIQRAPKLRGKIPNFELDVRLAAAYAGLGRFDEGLALCQRYLDSPEVPASMYYGRLSELYEVAQRYDEAVACHREAYEVAEDSTTAVLDLAMALLRHNQDLELARKLIAEAEAMPISDVLQLFLPFLKGLAALNGHSHAEALDLLTRTEEMLRPVAAGSAPIRNILDDVQGFKAIAYAKTGRLDDARKCFAAARPRIEALNNLALLQRIEEALT